MPQSLGSFVENNFTRGVITESTGLNFPENAAIEAWNTRFNKEGNVSRRLGFGYENNTFSSTIPGFARGACRAKMWRGVNKIGDLDLLVAQMGSTIFFFEIDELGDYTNGRKSFRIELTRYKSREVGPRYRMEHYPFDCTYGNGRLYIVHPLMDPLYVEYDDDMDDITVTQYQVEIRDMEGLDDGLEVNERPATLSNAHKYNLYNQGWYAEAVAVDDDTRPPLTYWGEYKNDPFYVPGGGWPSNAEQWWWYSKAKSNGREEFSMNVVSSFPLGSSPAPKGHYIYNAFSIDRAREVGFGSFPIESSDGFRPSTIEFFAGRIWYSGVYNNRYFNKVYYTQIITTTDEIGKCYQLNDPTHKDYSDLLETDGGVIAVQGMAKCVKLLEFRNSMIIFATNGIWLIGGSGATGTGFTATDFTVQKISDTSCLSGLSVVTVEGTPIWWNYDGIWSLQPNEQSYSVVSVSNPTIKTFYNEEILPANREFVQGAYNPLEKTVQWLWRSVPADDSIERFQYDRILELNVATGAFYPHKWNLDDQFFSSIICTNDVKVTGLEEETVTSSSGIVTDSLGQTVTSMVYNVEKAISAKFKYIVVDDGTFAFLDERDDTYYDFVARYGAATKDYSSYFITGYKVHGEGHKDMGVGYFTIFTNYENNSGCFIQGRWDWSSAFGSGKWNNPQQVYFQRQHRAVNHRRLLMRGMGKAIQLYFYSEAGKPFDIIGWSSWEHVDGQP